MGKLNQFCENWKKKSQISTRLIAFGSSNTELGWHSEGHHNWVDWLNLCLRRSIGNHVSLINQGIGGETGTDLLGRIERDVFSFSPELVIVTIAGNDALRPFTVKSYTQNLRKICEQIAAHDAQPVLQTYYCPLFEQFPAEFEHRFETFAGVNRALAAERNYPIIDQYRCFEPFYRNDSEAYRTVMRDGLHLKPVGNLLMGTMAGRAFGLPDPEIPAAMQAEFDEMMARMAQFCNLPEKKIN